MTEHKQHDQMKVLLDQFLDHPSPPSPRKREELHQWLSTAETFMARPTDTKSHGRWINVSHDLLTCILYLLAIEVTNEDWSSLAKNSGQNITQSVNLIFTPDHEDYLTVSRATVDLKRERI